MNIIINKFILFALIGWILEIICISNTKKKLSNNHFLFTPFCPMYGLGGLFISLAINNISNLFFIFIISLIIATLVEYSFSYFMEKIFSYRWWDYSYKKYHLNGRISITTSISFGLLGLVIKIIDNYLSYSFNYTYIVLAFITLDLIISTYYTYIIANNKSYKNNTLTKYIKFKLSNLP